MTEEQKKAYAVKHFPYDEFRQQAIIDAINWATKELQEEIRKKADTNHSLVEQNEKLLESCAGTTMMYEDLCKAKELLGLFVQWNYGCCDIPDYKEIMKQAEQFLKE